MGAFTTRHTCDMRITFVSDKFNYILKSELKTLMGTSYYELVHPADMTIVAKAMKELFAKGHIRTPYYRLIAANDTLAWIQTEATTITHTTKGQKGQYVICVHYVLGIQGAEESLVVCTDAMPAGMQVDIKKEIDDTRDYIGRQPEIVECVDFTPLIETEDPFEIEQIMPQQEASKPADMGIYSVTDEYEQRVYGKVTSSEDFLNSTETEDMESDCESIEDAGLAPEFDVDLAPFYEEKMEVGARKNSYDDVLQWLFRDQPSSPPPTRYRSADRFRSPTETSNFEASLASPQFMDSSSRASRSKNSYGRRAQSTGSRTTNSSSNSGSASSTQPHSTNYSPLAEGISQCGLNSPPSLKSGQVLYGNARPVVGRCDPSNPSRRFSAISPSDTLDVSSTQLSQSRIHEVSDVFASMPFADPLINGNERSDSNDDCNAGISSSPTLVGCEPIICDDLQWEEPDLSCLAPFVDTCDMLQIDEGLSPELQALYDLPDFTPAVPQVPAARPVHIDRSPPTKRMHHAPSDMNFMYNNQYQSFQQDNSYWQSSQQQLQQQPDRPYSPFTMLC
ncbi:unnamed protein product [Caenorhabditis brenneri]